MCDIGLAVYFVLLLQDEGSSYSDQQYLKRYNIEWILGNVISDLFLELAILMNVTKWIYYFLVMLTHRNIREEEIKVEVYADFEGH